MTLSCTEFSVQPVLSGFMHLASPSSCCVLQAPPCAGSAAQPLEQTLKLAWGAWPGSRLTSAPYNCSRYTQWGQECLTTRACVCSQGHSHTSSCVPCTSAPGKTPESSCLGAVTWQFPGSINFSWSGATVQTMLQRQMILTAQLDRRSQKHRIKHRDLGTINK